MNRRLALVAIALFIGLAISGSLLLNHVKHNARTLAAASPSLPAAQGDYNAERLSPSGPQPAPRSGAMMIWTGQDLLLFGGYKGSQQCCLDDLFAYDPLHNVWMQR